MSKEYKVLDKINDIETCHPGTLEAFEHVANVYNRQNSGLIPLRIKNLPGERMEFYADTELVVVLWPVYPTVH